MKQSRVKFAFNDNYNMNCDIDELKKLGFQNSSYHNDLAPSYTNSKGNIQVYFFDLEDESIKNEGIEYKYSILKLDEHGEYLDDIGQVYTFDEMIKLLKENETNLLSIDFNTTLSNKDMCEKFITSLYTNNKLFHFDDDPSVQTDKNGNLLFTTKECELLKKIIDEIFEILDDPYELAVELVSQEQINVS